MISIRHSAGLNPRDAPDELVRGPLWLWHLHQIQAVKTERLRRKFTDIDLVDAPVETEYS